MITRRAGELGLIVDQGIIARRYGCIDDWQSRSYVLSDRKGSTVMVRDLGDLWPAAQQLARRRLDPLEPQFLAALSQPGTTQEPGS